MESIKLGSQNPLMQDNKMTQKLVQYGDHNKLWDDVAAIEDSTTAVQAQADDLQTQIDNLPTGGGGGPQVKDGTLVMGTGSLCVVTYGEFSAAPTVVSAYVTLKAIPGFATGIAMVSAGDLIKTVYTEANPVLTYGIAGSGGPPPVMKSDPYEAAFVFTDQEIGTQPLDLTVTNSENATTVTHTVTVMVLDIPI